MILQGQRFKETGNVPSVGQKLPSYHLNHLVIFQSFAQRAIEKGWIKDEVAVVVEVVSEAISKEKDSKETGNVVNVELK